MLAEYTALAGNFQQAIDLRSFMCMFMRGGFADVMLAGHHPNPAEIGEHFRVEELHLRCRVREQGRSV